MSDDPSVTAPEPGGPDGADPGPPDAGSRSVGRLSRLVPSWARHGPEAHRGRRRHRRGRADHGCPLRDGALRPARTAVRQPAEAILRPGQPGPCGEVPARRDRHPVERHHGPLGRPGPARHLQVANRSGGDDRTLVAQTFVFTSKTALADAGTSYRENRRPGAACPCTSVAVSKRPVAGLEDKAEEVYVAPRPDPAVIDAHGFRQPRHHLVRFVEQCLYRPGPRRHGRCRRAFLARPPDAALLAGSCPWRVTSWTHWPAPRPSRRRSAATVAPQAYYADRRDPCRLISQSTVARYAPGAFLQPDPATGGNALPEQSECEWNADDGTSVALTLQLSPGVDGAEAAFDADVGLDREHGNRGAGDPRSRRLGRRLLHPRARLRPRAAVRLVGQRRTRIRLHGQGLRPL